MIKTIARTLLLGPKLDTYNWDIPSKDLYLNFYKGWITLKRNHILKTLSILETTGKKTFRVIDNEEKSITINIDDFKNALNAITLTDILERGNLLYIKKIENKNFNKNIEKFLTGPYSAPVYKTLIYSLKHRFVDTYIYFKLSTTIFKDVIIPEDILLKELLINKGSSADDNYFKAIYSRNIDVEIFTKNGLALLYKILNDLIDKYDLTDHDAITLIKY